MSFPGGRAFSRAGYSFAHGKQTRVSRRGSRVLRGRGSGRGLEVPHGGQGEGGFQDLQGFKFETEPGEALLCGREERPGTPVKDGDGGGGDDAPEGNGDPLAFAARFADDSTATIMQQLLGQDVWGVGQVSPPESCSVDVPALWLARAGGAPVQSCVGVPPASLAPSHISGPEGGRDPRGPKRGCQGMVSVRGDWRWPSAEGPSSLPSDTESLDDVSELQIVRMNIYAEEVDPASTSSPEDARDTPLPSNFVVGESACCMPPGTVVPSAPQRLPVLSERQVAAAHQEPHPTKQPPGLAWGKEQGKPSSSGAGVAPPWARKKERQERKPLVDPSKVTLGRIFPPWGQRASAGPPEPASLPPVAGVPLLGSSAKRFPQVPLSAKPPKPKGAAGKKCVARRSRECEQVAREADGANRGPVTKGQLSAHRPGPSQSVHRRERRSGGNLDARDLQVSGVSLPLVLSQGSAVSRGPAYSSDQEPPDHASRQERQQQPPGGQGCSRCVVLEEEINDLKEQLAILKSLTYNFPALSS